MAQAEEVWGGLSGNYDTPDGYMLLGTFDPALGNTEFTTGVATLVAPTMGGLASPLQELEPRRQQPIVDAKTFSTEKCPSNDTEYAARQKEKEEIQQHISTLVEEYHQKIKDCITHLTRINSEGGYSDLNAPDLGGYV